jgi:hypothetical protein
MDLAGEHETAVVQKRKLKSVQQQQQQCTKQEHVTAYQPQREIGLKWHISATKPRSWTKGTHDGTNSTRHMAVAKAG